MNPQGPHRQLGQFMPQTDYQSSTVPAERSPKKSRLWLWIAAILAAFWLGVGVVYISPAMPTMNTDTSSSSQTTDTSTQPTQPPATPTPTPRPTQPPKWTTTHTFTGNGTKKTEIFTVAGDWKLQWKCNPAANILGEYNVIIDVLNTDGTSFDSPAINTICEQGNVQGETQEHEGGKVYLDINSEDTWTITIQELR